MKLNIKKYMILATFLCMLFGCASQPVIKTWDETCKDPNFINASVEKKHEILNNYYYLMYNNSLSKKLKQKVIGEMEIQAGLRKPEPISVERNIR